MKRKSPSRKNAASSSRAKGRRYRVQLPFEETLELVAPSAEEAWRRYCQQRGIIRSEHVPRIEPVD